MDMKNTAAAAVAALVIGGTANASDIDRNKIVATPQIQKQFTQYAKASVYNWTGMYVGGHVGYGWGEHSFDTSLYHQGMVLPNSQVGFNSSGMIFGIQAGANRQFNNNIVLGIEADVAYSTIKGNSGNAGPVTGLNGGSDGYYSSGTKFDGIATARARIGYAFDRLLPYATGGLAIGHGKGAISNINGVTGEYTSGSEFTVGWTAGVGLEYAMENNISLKAEYLHTNFANASYWMSLPTPSSSTRMNDDAAFNTMKLGVNWKFN